MIYTWDNFIKILNSFQLLFEPPSNQTTLSDSEVAILATRSEYVVCLLSCLPIHVSIQHRSNYLEYTRFGWSTPQVSQVFAQSGRVERHVN